MYDYHLLIGYQLAITDALVKRGLQKTFRDNDIDLTFEQWTVLNALYLEPGLVQQDIALKTYKDKTNIARILKVLHRRGLIAKKKGEDVRELRIMLTSAGKQIVDKAIPHVQNYNISIRSDIDNADMKEFSATLTAIRKSISDYVGL